MLQKYIFMLNIILILRSPNVYFQIASKNEYYEMKSNRNLIETRVLILTYYLANLIVVVKLCCIELIYYIL